MIVARPEGDDHSEPWNVDIGVGDVGWCRLDLFAYAAEGTPLVPGVVQLPELAGLQDLTGTLASPAVLVVDGVRLRVVWPTLKVARQLDAWTGTHPSGASDQHDVPKHRPGSVHRGARCTIRGYVNFRDYVIGDDDCPEWLPGASRFQVAAIEAYDGEGVWTSVDQAEQPYGEYRIALDFSHR